MDTTRTKLLIKGLRGFFAGEQIELRPGEALVVGRSRDADLSLRRAPRFRKRKDAVKVMKTEAFRSVSRYHVRVRFVSENLVEVRDLSSNGTWLDGERIDHEEIRDLSLRKRELRLGNSERLEICLAPAA